MKMRIFILTVFCLTSFKQIYSMDIDSNKGNVRDSKFVEIELYGEKIRAWKPEIFKHRVDFQEGQMKCTNNTAFIGKLKANKAYTGHEVLTDHYQKFMANPQAYKGTMLNPKHRKEAWTRKKNMAFMAGAVSAGKNFILVTPLENYLRSDFITYTKQELITLFENGYHFTLIDGKVNAIAPDVPLYDYPIMREYFSEDGLINPRKIDEKIISETKRRIENILLMINEEVGGNLKRKTCATADDRNERPLKRRRYNETQQSLQSEPIFCISSIEGTGSTPANPGISFKVYEMPSTPATPGNSSNDDEEERERSTLVTPGIFFNDYEMPSTPATPGIYSNDDEGARSIPAIPGISPNDDEGLPIFDAWVFGSW